MLQNNTPALDFSSTNQRSETVKLTDFSGKKNIVLYFYPKDDTPGCTIEANQFTDLINEFTEQDTVILGVSKDDSNSHQAFIDKFNLKIDLLADTDGSLCEAYNVWQEKEKNGVKKMGIVRSTFIIDKSATLIDAEYAVAAEGHAARVLEKIKTL